MLRIPAIALGFVYRWEWDAFLDKHEEEFDWSPGCFASALCSSYPWDDYMKWLMGKGDDGPGSAWTGTYTRIRCGRCPGRFSIIASRKSCRLRLKKTVIMRTTAQGR